MTQISSSMTGGGMRNCFLIDTLLEGPKISSSRIEQDPISIVKRHSPFSSIEEEPSSSSPHNEEIDVEEQESEPDNDHEIADESEEEDLSQEGSTSHLHKIISNMIDKQQREKPDNMLIQPPQPLISRPMPTGPFPNPLNEYLKLQLMQHAAMQWNTFAALQQRNPLMIPPAMRTKDSLILSQRSSMPLIQRPRSESASRGNVKKYRCDICEKTFSRSNTLITHKRIHTGEKPFKCDHCGRAFRQPGNLTRHRLTHTTVKPYVCSECDKAFNRASNLHTHMRTHVRS